VSPDYTRGRFKPALPEGVRFALLIRGEFTPVTPEKFREIAEAIQRRKKDAVLNIRINREDLEQIKRKAKRMGIKYQTFISEILHLIAHQ